MDKRLFPLENFVSVTHEQTEIYRYRSGEIVVIRNCPHFRYVMDMGSQIYLEEEMLVSIFISNVELSESDTESFHMKCCSPDDCQNGNTADKFMNLQKYSGRTLLIEKNQWHSY